VIGKDAGAAHTNQKRLRLHEAVDFAQKESPRDEFTVIDDGDSDNAARDLSRCSSVTYWLLELKSQVTLALAAEVIYFCFPGL